MTTQILRDAALLSGADTWSTRAEADTPALVLSDGPHGIRRQLGAGDHLGLNESQPATCFPVAGTMAASWDTDLIEEMGRALGQEAVALGVNVVLGPGLNIKRHPLCGRNFEYYSEDPYLSGTLAAALIRGIQSAGVSACPKHFAVNSQETRRMATDSIVDERTLRELYLTGFEIAVREGRPLFVMSSYNMVNGVYSHENPHLIGDILRGEWGFEGAVVSDWGGSNDAAAAVAAGSTLEMPSPGYSSVPGLAAAVRDGRLKGSRLHEEAERMRTLARRLGDPARTGTAADENAQADPDGTHRALAARLAEASAVLLRNTDGVLPLESGTKVAVIGEFADQPRFQGAGSSKVNPTGTTSALAEYRAAGLDVVGYERAYGVDGSADPASVDRAVALARRVEVAIVHLGLDEVTESEGLDRSTIELPASQLALIDALRNVDTPLVVVLTGGSVMNLAPLESVAALIYCGLGGQEVGVAQARILTGAACPSGKLAETFVTSLDCLPANVDYPARGRHAFYREGPYVGYRYFGSSRNEHVAFPFGFGLSYASFAYANLEIDEDGVSFELTNTSQREGAEVSQLYIHRGEGSLYRPEIELRGFAKTTLGPGETRRVRIGFDQYTFRSFDTGSGSWVVEGGTWEVRVGGSSENTPLVGTLEVEGSGPTPSEHAPACYRTGDVGRVSDEDFAALLGRPLPTKRPGEITDNTAVCDLIHAPSRLARVVASALIRAERAKRAKGQLDVNLLFLVNMPLRAMAKMTGGLVTPDMVTDGFVPLVSGHFWRGVSGLLRGFMRGRAIAKRIEKELSHG